MKKNTLLIIGFIAMIAITTDGFTQIPTIIDYTKWSSSDCNIFAASTDVPATIGSSTTTVNIAHITNIGQPQYSAGTNKAVRLYCEYTNPEYKGSEYRITYNFKNGYSYRILINAACINSNAQNSHTANLRVKPNTGGNGGNNKCNGYDIIDANTSGSGYQNSPMVGGTTWTDYIYGYQNITQGYSYLNISAIPQQDAELQTVLIRMVTIEETAPLVLPPSFTLAPLTVAKACGTAISQTFTVTNVNSTAGVTGYAWTIGTGWKLQNGTIPTSPYPTTTSTLTLTSDANVSNLGNVSVAAQFIGSSVNASGSCVVSNSIPYNFSINGSLTVCTTSSYYSVSNLPPAARVTWLIAPSYIVSQSSTTIPNQVKLTPIGTGDIILKASVNNICSTPVISNPLSIHVGIPSIPSLLSAGKVKGTLQTNGSITYKGQAFLQTPAPNYPYQWKVDGYIQQSIGSTGEFNVPNCSNTVNGITQDYSINVKATNTCGSSEGCGIFRYVCKPGTSSTLNRIIDCTVYPPAEARPAPNRFILSEDSAAANQLQIDVAILSEDNFAQLYPDADSLNTEMVQTVSVYDVEGNLVQEADTVNAKQANIDLSGLPEGNYNVVVGGNNDYTEQQTYKFTVVKTEQQLAEEIATGNYTIPTPDEADRKEVLKQQLFKELLNKESLVNASTILQNFVATKDQENYGFIRKITEAFDNGDTAAVSSLLSQWVPQNQQDQNCIDYFNLYLRLLSNDTFTYTDINNLYDLANRCPLKDGEIIYAARSLYNFMTESNETFDNACDGVAGRGTKRTKAPAKSRYLPTVIKVYPNPAKGSFNIDFPATEKGQSTLTLTDVFGKKVLQKTVSQRLNNISLPTGTATGIYMIHITNQKTGKQQTQKIVVKSM